LIAHSKTKKLLWEKKIIAIRKEMEIGKLHTANKILLHIEKGK